MAEAGKCWRVGRAARPDTLTARRVCGAYASSSLPAQTRNGQRAPKGRVGVGDSAGVRVGDTAGDGGVERGEPRLTFLDEANAFTKNLTARVVATGLDELVHGLLQGSTEVDTAGHGGSVRDAEHVGMITVIRYGILDMF